MGNRVLVFSRQLNLIDYGDQYTANKLGSKKERYCTSLIIITPILPSNLMNKSVFKKLQRLMKSYISKSVKDLVRIQQLPEITMHYKHKDNH